MSLESDFLWLTSCTNLQMLTICLPEWQRSLSTLSCHNFFFKHWEHCLHAFFGRPAWILLCPTALSLFGPKGVFFQWVEANPSLFHDYWTTISSFRNRSLPTSFVAAYRSFWKQVWDTKLPLVHLVASVWLEGPMLDCLLDLVQATNHRLPVALFRSELCVELLEIWNHLVLLEPVVYTPAFVSFVAQLVETRVSQPVSFWNAFRKCVKHAPLGPEMDEWMGALRSQPWIPNDVQEILRQKYPNSRVATIPFQETFSAQPMRAIDIVRAHRCRRTWWISPPWSDAPHEYEIDTILPDLYEWTRRANAWVFGVDVHGNALRPLNWIQHCFLALHICFNFRCLANVYLWRCLVFFVLPMVLVYVTLNKYF